jgi:RHS repeat-associated protein
LTGINVYLNGQLIRTANYIYDVYDQRIAKIVDLDGDGSGAATTERFVYGSNQNIALVFDGNGLLKNRYLFANGIDQIEADEQFATGTTLWALTDHLGSVRDVVDNSGVSQNHIVYDAFGNITSQSNSSVIFRNTYTGQEFDPESGLFSYGGRYYDPYNGKFIQEDKIGFSGEDINLYRYVENSPIVFNDPTGLFRVLPRYNPPNRVPSISPSRTDPFIFPKLPTPNQPNPFEQPRNLIEPKRSPLSVTTERDDPGKLFIPFPRKGPQRKSPAKKPGKEPPNPNSCDVRPKNGCPEPYPTFYESPELTEHYLLVQTAIQRDNQPIFLQKADILVNEKYNRPVTNRYMGGKNAFGPARKYSLTGEMAVWDEYPYASTVEGGFGATIGAVSENDNKIAAIQLQFFYNNKKVDSGCYFFVSL